MNIDRSAKAFALRFAVSLLCVLAFAGSARAADPFRFAGAPCVAPPRLKCPDKDCPSDRVINEGNVVEMKTRRTYFLDYPCDLKPGEKVTFILSLHGAGSYGNWQRHYFPIIDYKDKYRLVIATPNSPTRGLVRGRRRVSAEHRRPGGRADRQGEHQGVLAGRPLAGRA